MSATTEMEFRAFEIANDLDHLVPLGTLYFIDAPKKPAAGIVAPDGWYWFDPPYLRWNVPLLSTVKPGSFSFCQLLTDLCYLIERYNVCVTYKETGMITCLRVYVIQSDIQGNRHLELLRSSSRRGRTLGWHSSKLKAIMKKLIRTLDYSSESWADGRFRSGLIFNALKDYKPFDPQNVGNASCYYGESCDDDLNYHILRLTQGKAFHFKKRQPILKDLEMRLTDIYNSVTFGNKFQEYYSKVSQIQGLKSTLYNYQVESIAKMASNEAKISRQLMPNLLAFQRQSSTFYLDLSELKFKESPEYYESSRGGILAENMGLGKTLICLSLIILTKHEISEIPEDCIIKDVRDHKTLPLLDQCIRVINRHSIPWRNHVDHIPENCVKSLENQPGFFYLKRNKHNPKSQTRSNSRSGSFLIEEKLLLSSSTLVVVPDNLFNQWCNEIEKHVLSNSLTVLKLSRKATVPKALLLIKFDLILITHSTYISEDSTNSQLKKVYWKRLIIDEGHSMNQRASRLVELSKSLKIERKWIVSSTPTSGLTKLQITENNDEKNHLIKRKFDAKTDLTKLGYLVSNFFAIKPWSSNNDLWNKLFMKPLVDGNVHSDEALIDMMNLLMIRHSFSEVETDVALPPLYGKPVFLTPSYHNKLSINLFIAVLAINAVSSEREDKDYMFHPSNKQDLRTLVTNLQRSTFHWTGFTISDLKNLISFAKICMDKKYEADSATFYYSRADRNLLRDCIHYCKVALNDMNWRTASSVHEMLYFVDENLDDQFQQHFGLRKSNGQNSVFGAPQIYALQKFFYGNRFSKGEEAFTDKIIQSSDAFWKSYWKDLTNKRNAKIKNDGKRIEFSQINRELLNKDHQQFLKTPESIDSSDKTSSISKILGTVSSKLSYMCSRLLEHQFQGIKSIVFFEFEDSAYYLSESLDLIGVDYILYSTSVPQSQRFQRINDFTNRKGGVSLIMDLKLASFGLTIIEATRVYFLNPVWNRSIEAQAIKRAHRIGQTREVYVETLVLKDTLEEQMYNKRFMRTHDEIDELKIPVADDAQIRDYITRFEFLRIGKDEKEFSEFRSESTCTEDVINGKQFDENELLEPVGYKVENEIVWEVPLFSKGSQSKVGELEGKRRFNLLDRHNSIGEVTVNMEEENDKQLQDSDDDHGDTTESEELRPIISPQKSKKKSRKRVANDETDILDDETAVRKTVRFT